MAHENDRPMKAPPHNPGSWGGFVHVKARFFQNYLAMIMRAAHRKRKRSVDVDVQKSKDGTPWCFHWATIGKGKYHDIKGVWGRNTRIDHLTDAQIEARLRGPKGQHPVKLETALKLAEQHNVRVEVEVKTTLAQAVVEKLLAVPEIARMNAKGLLQFKTLAFMGAPNGGVSRLRPVHNAGGTTILSFTDYKRNKPGVSKQNAWPVVDYTRGRAKWAA